MSGGGVAARALALVLLALAPPAGAAAQPRPKPNLIMEGATLARALDAFGEVCVARPLDLTGQRRAATAAPWALKRKEDRLGFESYVDWPLQVSLGVKDGARVCAVVAIVDGSLDPAAAARATVARLRLAGGLATSFPGGEWRRVRGGRAETVQLQVAPGAESSTVLLTLSAKRAG